MAVIVCRVMNLQYFCGRFEKNADMISGLNYDKKDGIQLAIGGGTWYLFYDKSKEFRKKHHFHEKRIVNGILYCRVIGRFVFIKDLPMKYRMLWDRPLIQTERDEEGNLKRMTILHP